MEGFTVRKMELSDIETAVRWANSEGWLPGLRAEEAFALADPDGLFAGILNGVMISSVTAVSYDGRFGFIGMYIVKPEYRGKGYGLLTWNAGMDYLAGQTIGLDGVVAQQENYQKSGFRVDYRNARYQGVFKGTQREGTVDLHELSWADVLAYDRKMFPAKREKLLEFWVSGEGVRFRACVADGRITGYGVSRPCRGGVRIGPLFAEDYRTADILLDDLTTHLGDGDAVYLDIPTNNPDALKLVKDRGMEPVFETLRMYNGTFPELPKDKIFGISSFELG